MATPERIISAAPLIKLPDGIACETAAAMTMRGLTSAYLMRRIYPFKAGDTVLLHAAAGGVGLIVSQWAKLLGLTVIGTVSTEEKAAVAKAHGNFKRAVTWPHESGFRYVLHNSGDKNRELILTVLVFHVPT